MVLLLDIINFSRLEFLLFKLKGPAVAQGLAEIILKRPADPVEYLANYLYKYKENKNQQQKV